MSISIILLGIIVALVLYAAFAYNSLILWRNRVKEAWSDIEVQLKRRMDLIPNLVESVKGYMQHEKGVLESVTKARTQMMNAQNPKEFAEAENMLSGALKSLFAVSESYPDLKASQNFLDLQNELTDTENKIQAARRFYNSAVMAYNTKLQTVPTNIIANMFKFEEAEFFELDEEEKEKAKEPVKVDFNTDNQDNSE